ncbi:MAG: cytochrome c biogenesis protein CcdA [Patescibacteria group bacterium]
MFGELASGSEVSIVAAFVAGVVTFFASCLLPLVPTYLAYLAGVSLQKDGAQHRWRIFYTSVFFSLGFTATFVVLGLLLYQFSAVIAPFRFYIEKISGVFFLLIGLWMLGLLKSTALLKERRLDFGRFMTGSTAWHAIPAGVAFGFGWTPCIGPVLALILFWSAQQDSALQGTMLLIVYGIGLGFPFVLTGLLFEKILPALKKYGHISHYVQIFSGVIIAIAGLLLLTGWFAVLSMYLLSFTNISSLAQ